MSDRRQESFIVALDFGESTPELVAAAKAVASQTGWQPRFVYVNEPWSGRNWVIGFPSDVSSAAVAEEVEYASEIAADEKLTEVIQETFSEPLPPRTVVTGPTVSCLISEAVSHRARFILVGAKPETQSALFKGMSTALSLMSEASVPVVVVPQGCGPRLSKSAPKIMLADDLTTGCLGAVSTAFHLGNSLNASQLTHLHVNGLKADTMMERVMEAINERRSSKGDPFTTDSLLRASEEAQLGQLKARAQAFQGQLTYEPMVKSGLVAETLQDTTEHADADILVFGRHHTLHRKPFGVGRMTFQQMLSSKRVVVVAPSLL